MTSCSLYCTCLSQKYIILISGRGGTRLTDRLRAISVAAFCLLVPQFSPTSFHGAADSETLVSYDGSVQYEFTRLEILLPKSKQVHRFCQTL